MKAIKLISLRIINAINILLRSYSFWVLVVAIATGVIVPVSLNYCSKSSDLEINIIPIDGVVERGSTLMAKVVVESQKYDAQILLTARNPNEHIDITFEPSSGVAKPKFESDIKISAFSSIATGVYTLEITAIGAKNKVERTTNFFLTVVNPPFIPQNLRGLFFPDGFMGDIQAITLDYNSPDNPYEGESCIKIAYSGRGGNGFGGIYWLFPNHNFGSMPNGRNLVGAETLTFMARGARGGERADFKIGGVSSTYTESLYPAISMLVTLTADWQEYSFDLRGKDLSNVIGGFCWVTNSTQNPNGCVIYLDSIFFR